MHHDWQRSSQSSLDSLWEDMWVTSSHYKQLPGVIQVGINKSDHTRCPQTEALDLKQRVREGRATCQLHATQYTHLFTAHWVKLYWRTALDLHTLLMRGRKNEIQINKGQYKHQWAVETTGGSVLLSTRRDRHAMNDSGNANSLQQMWTSATNDANISHAQKKHCNFSFFSRNSLTAAPILFSLCLSFPLSLSLYVRSAADKWCMPLSLHEYDNIKDCMRWWQDGEGPWERETTWDEEQCHLASMMAAWLHCLPPPTTALLFFLGESLSSPPLWSPRPCS